MTTGAPAVMKWVTVSPALRLCAAFIAIAGLVSIGFMWTVASEPRTIVFLLIGAVGAVAFGFAAIAGRFPDISGGSKGRK
jgi:hypothetical protein